MAHSRPGILIAFEGIDGAGKTTQVQLLADALRSAGEEVVSSKEPTNGPWGQKIRASAATGRLPLHEELEAFVQDRIEHVASTIRPNLDAGRIVLLDRYFYSTIAYQGSRGADVEELDRQMRTIAPVPDVVYVLDLDPAAALARIRVRDEAPNEFEKLDSLQAVRAVFHRLREIDRVLHEVDGAEPPEAVHRSILTHLLDGALREKRSPQEHKRLREHFAAVLD